MSGYQKVYLRVAGLVGDTTSDDDEMPDRVLATGSGLLTPSLPEGTGDIARGPDGLEEIMIPDQVPFSIVDGMLTQGDNPYVWLPVPSSRWTWNIEFSRVVIGGRSWQLGSFSFPLLPATQAQIESPGYPGVNLAYYAVGSWAPGEVEALSRRLGNLESAMLLAQREAAAATAARYAAESAARRAERAAGLPITQWREEFLGPALPEGWYLATEFGAGSPGTFTPPGLSDVVVRGPVVGENFDLTIDFVRVGQYPLAGFVITSPGSELYVQVVTAVDPEGGSIVQMAGQLSAPLGEYTNMTLVRRGNLWSCSVDGAPVVDWQTGEPIEVEAPVDDGARCYLLTEGSTITRATYREMT